MISTTAIGTVQRSVGLLCAAALLFDCGGTAKNAATPTDHATAATETDATPTAAETDATPATATGDTNTEAAEAPPVPEARPAADPPPPAETTGTASASAPAQPAPELVLESDGQDRDPGDPHAGIKAYLSGQNQPTSPLGRDTALGVEAEPVGALVGHSTPTGGQNDATASDAPPAHCPGTGKPARGKVKLDEKSMMVKGGFSNQAVSKIITRKIDGAVQCYQASLARNPVLAGKITVKFIVAATGVVQLAAEVTSTPGASPVAKCVTQAMRAWQFPDSNGVKIITVSFELSSSCKN